MFSRERERGTERSENSIVKKDVQTGKTESPLIKPERCKKKTQIKTKLILCGVIY